jgi:hypothetical protein
MRDKRITVRLTEEQYEALERLRGSIPRSEFLYLILLDYLGREQELVSELRRIETRCLNKCEFFRALYAELGKIGGNINQIARQLNKKKGGRAVSSHLLDLVLETVELIVELKELLMREKSSQGT